MARWGLSVKMKFLLSAGYLALLITLIFSLNPGLALPSLANKILYQMIDQNTKLRVTGFEAYLGQPPVNFLYRQTPERTGIGNAPFIKLPLELAWQKDHQLIDVHTASKATPAVDASGVYFGSDSGVFYRFDHQGNLAWKFFSDSSFQGIHGTATTDDEYVYFGTYSGMFYCLNKKNGRLVWMTDLANAVGSSPLIVGNRIYVSGEFSDPREGYLVALDRTNGKMLWKSDYFGEQVHSSPSLDQEAKIIGIGNNASEFLGIDSETGSTLWKKQVLGPMKGTALVFDNHFIFSTWGKKVFSLKSFNGALQYSIDLPGKSQSSPTLDPKNKLIAIGTEPGEIIVFEAITGNVRWQYQSSSPTEGQAKPSGIYAVDYRNKRSLLVISCQNTKLCVFDFLTGKMVQNIPLRNSITGAPTIYNGDLYFLEDGFGVTKLSSQAMP